MQHVVEFMPSREAIWFGFVGIQCARRRRGASGRISARTDGLSHGRFLASRRYARSWPYGSGAPDLDAGCVSLPPRIAGLRRAAMSSGGRKTPAVTRKIGAGGAIDKALEERSFLQYPAGRCDRARFRPLSTGPVVSHCQFMVSKIPLVSGSCSLDGHESVGAVIFEDGGRGLPGPAPQRSSPDAKPVDRPQCA